MFDLATDLANQGRLLEAMPLYDTALHSFEGLGLPEIERIREEVYYWRGVTERHYRTRG
jgi:hypothetical protein